MAQQSHSRYVAQPAFRDASATLGEREGPLFCHPSIGAGGALLVIGDAGNQPLVATLIAMLQRNFMS